MSHHGPGCERGLWGSTSQLVDEYGSADLGCWGLHSTIVFIWFPIDKAVDRRFTPPYHTMVDSSVGDDVTASGDRRLERCGS